MYLNSLSLVVSLLFFVNESDYNLITNRLTNDTVTKKNIYKTKEIIGTSQ